MLWAVDINWYIMKAAPRGAAFADCQEAKLKARGGESSEDDKDKLNKFQYQLVSRSFHHSMQSNNETYDSNKENDHKFAQDPSCY